MPDIGDLLRDYLGDSLGHAPGPEARQRAIAGLSEAKAKALLAEVVKMLERVKHDT